MKIKNFLALGTFALATNIGLSTSLAQASEIIEKNEVTKKISQLYQEQKNLGVFEVDSEIEVQIVKPTKRINPVTQKETFEAPALNETHAQIIKNTCKVSLSYAENGDSLQLTSNIPILKATQLLEPKQKEMMRELIALHEGFHCELANIDNPIIIKGESRRFNEKLNYYLKDSQSVTDSLGTMSYMGTLNENFADIAAAGSLLKKYGKDDKDFQKVLSVFKTQRHANYFERDTDVHFTHIGLDEVMKPEVQDKIINIKDGKEYKQYALEMANESVQKLMVQRKDISDQILGNDILGSAVMINLIQKIMLASAGEEKKKEVESKLSLSFRTKNVDTGFTEDVAQELLKFSEGTIKETKSILRDESLTDSQKESKIKDMIPTEFFKIYRENAVGAFAARDYRGFEKTINKFKSLMDERYVKNGDDIDDFSKRFVIKHDSTTQEPVAVISTEINEKDKVLSKIDILRNRFLNSEKNLSNNQKLK